MSKKVGKKVVTRKAVKVTPAPEPVEAETGLTTKQRLFVEAYLSNGFNAKEAASKAGYKGDANTLAVVGFENLRKPNIAALVFERINEAAMSANEVLARLSKQARGSLFDLLDKTGEFSLEDARSRGVDDLMKKLKVKKRVIQQKGKDAQGNPEPPEVEYEYEYEIYDAQAALVHLGKYHKLFVERSEITGKDGKPIEVKSVKELSDGELAAIATRG